jgi:hypothetical protein
LNEGSFPGRHRGAQHSVDWRERLTRRAGCGYEGA